MSILPAISESINHSMVCIKIHHYKTGGFLIEHSPMNNMDIINEYRASTAEEAIATIKTILINEIKECSPQDGDSEEVEDWLGQHAAACQAFLNSI